MGVPITYQPHLLSPVDASMAMEQLWAELAWVRHDQTPRREYYVADNGLPYTYGRDRGRRTYLAQPTHAWIDGVWGLAEQAAGCTFDVCFLNGYVDGKDHLGWHADDSPEMDDDRPIAIVSLGAEREIWFRPNETTVQRLTDAELAAHIDPETAQHNLEALREKHRTLDKLLLGHGSLCLMQPGMQDTHQHRIPKSPRHDCGARISFTFRGFKA
ncbi:alkylated DNA repair dioxygenase [Variovorax paradoxus]|uniref:Alkylated DNA repair dioxygenase n=1 Tax=Variovorax paradoxus TaxID=34073 RepID=A0A5Q0M865_VARPD|nr:alpha-ketoglutarate-dependent dioxygenase AlkB [Variovorax paradoxus]QFZ84582.1 alkylated DNA repair dioxygenase [Variovorax paradoxus]